MKFFLPLNVKMPTTADILTFMSKKNNTLGLSDSEKISFFLDAHVYTYEHLKFHDENLKFHTQLS